MATATGAIIAIALQDFFVDSRVSRPRLRALQDLGVGLAVAHFGVLLVVGSAGPRWATAGIVMYAAATLLFLAALEAARRVPLPRTLVDDPMPRALITSGPFALIRHPFYVAYSLAWLAAPVATHGPVITVLSIGMVVIYVVAARREERQLAHHFGDAYRTYRLGTGWVLPSLMRLAGRSPH
jgi:protein-S-isoprenylcysteine O-methyltransferase Ste14